MPFTPVSTKRQHYQHPDEVKTKAIDFTPMLRDGETIISATVSISPSSGVTLGAASVVAEETVNEDGATVAVGNAVQFSLSALTVGTDYKVTVVATTDSASPSNVHVAVLTIYCRSE